MKLTKMMRESFVRAVMQDVPKVDYAAQIESIVQNDAIAKLPPKIKAIYNDKDLRHFIGTKRVYLDGTYVAVYGPEYSVPPEITAQVNSLSAQKDTQRDARYELERKITGVAISVSTVKALSDLLPEFAKYMPQDDQAAIRTLPCVQNVVADFVKAGWPVGKAKAK